MEQNLNFNMNQCVKQINNIGETVYQNICTGTSSAVPWGTLDWIIPMVLIVGCAAATVLFAAYVIAFNE